MLRFLTHSLIPRLIVLLAAFVAVPAFLYGEFRAADEARQALLLQTIREKGLVITRALAPVLARADTLPYFKLGEELGRIAGESVTLKLLFRPADQQDYAGFFYVASSPPVETAALEIERRRLIEAGILPRLAQSCEGELPLALRIDRPGGGAELLTSITPVRTTGGCWALVASNTIADAPDARIGLPYWRSHEVQLAAAVYLGLALLVLGLFFGLWRSLIRFGRIARTIRQGHTTRFTERNTIPELAEVAASFDRMVETLRESAAGIRRAAEETAHAFKTPLGIARQSLEPIRRRLDAKDPHAVEALGAIEAAIGRLDDLVMVARRLDHAAADLLDPPQERVDLSALCRDFVRSYAMGLTADGARIEANLGDRIVVLGSAELIEAVIENLIDNAVSFSPPRGRVAFELRRLDGRAVITVEDEGPGVPPDRLERIFERYYSERPRQAQAASSPGGSSHSGLGLWVARRNVETLGGRIVAANSTTGGLRMTVELPCDR